MFEHPIDDLLPYLPDSRALHAIKRGRLPGPNWYEPVLSVEQLARLSDMQLLDYRGVGPKMVSELREAQRKALDAPQPTHRPRRGSDVEAWIKAKRDSYGYDQDGMQFAVLNDLLEDYRLHADDTAYLDTPREENGPANA